MKTHHLVLLPRDGFFCKDGKGWHTSESSRGHSLEWPWPSTVLGALRTAWGRLEQQRTGKVFSSQEWYTSTAPIQLARTVALYRPHCSRNWEPAHTIWPVPQDAVWLEKPKDDGSNKEGNKIEDHEHVYRLLPVPARAPTLGRDDDEVRERLWYPTLDAQKPLPSPRWWGHKELVRWLAGGKVPACGKKLAPVKRLQVHVGIRPETLTAEESILFSHDVVETLDAKAEWAIGVEVILPDDVPPPAVATLGADGRLVKIELLPSDLFEPPEDVLKAFRPGSRGLRLMTVTPVCFERGWLPDGLASDGDRYQGRLPGLEADVILRAALVPRPIAVSGWDLVQKQPKPTARMVAPGSVYYFERADQQPFSEENARKLWLAALGARTTEGFGRVVPGIWTPGESTK